MPSYKIIVVNYKDDFINEIYKYRYHLYVEVDKLLDEKEFENTVEFDKYDKNSIFFVALNKRKEILGMARIIEGSALPTVEEFKLEPQLIKEDLSQGKLVEISRFMVSPEYRKTFLMLNLIKALYLYSKKNNINYWLGCVEEWFLNTLKKIGGDLKILGEPIFCFNAMNYPFIVDLISLDNFLEKNKKLIFWFLGRSSKKILLEHV